MLFDLLALGILAVFVALGAYRGTLAGFLRVATLFCAYAAGLFVAAKLAPLIALLTGTSRVTSGALAGSGAFLLVYVVGSVCSAILIRRERANRDEIPRTAFDRFGGAFFGAGQAALALLLLGVLGSFLDAAHTAGVPQGSASAGDSYLVGSTRKVVAAGVSAAVGDGPGGGFAVKLASNPGSAVSSTQALLSHPRITALQSDALFWQYLSTGELDLALTRTSFTSISYDADLRGRLADLGLVSEAARGDVEVFRGQVRATLLEVAPRIQAVRNDPALAELAANPEIRAALESGNTFRLLIHPDFRRFVDRVLRDYEKKPGSQS
ncbi:MAG: CvpA family protein [Myxococcota bacterium]